MKNVSIQELAETYISNPTNGNFNLLYKRLLPGIRKYVWQFVQNYSQSTPDILNEIIALTFSKMYIKLHQYDNRWQFSTWVYRIARNEALQEINRINKLVYLSHFYEDEQTIDPLMIEGIINPEQYITTIDDELENEQLKQQKLYELVIEEMEQLKPLHKEILMDRELEHMRYDELALKYNIPLNTVKSRIHYARLKLKDRVKNSKIGVENG